MSQQQAPIAGQVSADGQFRWDGGQWAPIPRGEREPTSWTRPMQLAAAGLLALVAVFSVATSVIFYNHDAVKQALDTAGTQIPQGTSEDELITFTIVGAIGFAVFVGLLELFGALGAFLGWRWAFWYVLVLMGLGSLSAIFGLVGLFATTTTSPLPKGVQVVDELLALAAAAIFVWMILGVSRYGPWAMKKPGA